MSVIGYVVVNRNVEREVWGGGTTEGEERFRSPTTGDRNWQKRERTEGSRRTKNGEGSRKNDMDKREYCTTIRGAKADIATKKTQMSYGRILEKKWKLQWWSKPEK